MRFVDAQEGIVIPLGRQGENLVETVRFSTQGWAEEYGEGSFELIHKRNTDSVPYPVNISIVDGSVEWVVGGADTQFAGRGCAELVYVVGGAVAKSAIYATSVLKAIDGGDTPPEPWQSWVDEVLAAGAHATEGAENSEAWAVGQRNGVDVPETDITYDNNSKFYAEMAQQSAKDLGFAHFFIDDHGDLIMERTTNLNFTFEMIDGDLYVVVEAA